MKVFNVDEAAKMTRLSESWWRKKIWKKEIAFIKIGRRTLISESTINKLLEDSLVEAQVRKEGDYAD